MTKIITADRAAEIVAFAKRQLSGPAHGAPLYDAASDSNACIEIDLRDGEVSLSSYDDGGGTPGLVWSGVITRVTLNKALRRDAIEQTLDALAERLPTILAGATLDYDNGSNLRGDLTEKAANILIELEAGASGYTDPDHLANVWGSDDYLQEALKEVTADTTDEELAALVVEAKADAEKNLVILTGCSVETLFDYARNEAISDRLAA